MPIVVLGGGFAGVATVRRLERVLRRHRHSCTYVLTTKESVAKRRLHDIEYWPALGAVQRLSEIRQEEAAIYRSSPNCADDKLAEQVRARREP